MSNDRLDALRAVIEQNPNHTFARYGLAMEYVNRGQLEEAVAEFHGLVETDPDYAAAYYHYGRTLEKLERTAEARAVLEKGIEVTNRKGDTHARGELQTALDLLGA